jgi:phage terminase large subunit-like protein
MAKAQKATTRKPRSSRSSPSAAERRPEFVPGYQWDPAAAEAPVEFIQALCRHPDERGGDPKRIDLIEWQAERVLRPLFGWRRADGRLRFRRAGIFVPKKNRKSSLMSQLAQYMATCHAPAQDVFLAANDRLQARTMYRMVRQSVEASPTLSRLLEVIDSRSIIRNRETGKEIRCLSSDSWRNEGLNGSVILDEIHSFRSPDLVDALIYATRGTANGLVISISTAGSDRNGIGWRWWQDCELVINDPKVNPTFYGLIYAAKDDDDHSSPEVWRKANPSMGIAFPEDEFAADYQDAQTDPRKMSKFLRYSLNVWQAGDARWFQGDDWSKCGSAPLAPLAGRPCWVGVDLASNLDMTAAAFVFKEAGGSYSVEWKFWVPRETVADRVREGIPYDAWIRDGWVTVTDGHRLDHEAVARDIIAYGETHEIKAVGCDPWQAGALETLLQREGITTRDIPQRTSYLNAPCKLLEALVVEGRLRHGANPVATWNANNVCVYTDPTGMVKPDKAKSNEKIDGVAALVNALALASTDEDTGEAANLDDWKIRLI